MTVVVFIGMGMIARAMITMDTIRLDITGRVTLKRDLIDLVLIKKAAINSELNTG